MVLNVRGLTYRTAPSRAPVLDNLNFAMREGEIVCLLGVNGSGKSTLLKCIAGALRGERGSIRIDGEEDTPARRLARKLAYVPQVAGDCALTLLDIALMGRTPYLSALQTPQRDDEKLAHDALDRVGIAHLANRAFNRVSGGERQLALIARALVQAPKLFLMDEPTANLDLANQARVLEIIRDIAVEGTSILVTTHQPDQALQLGARAATLTQGRIGALGSAAEIVSPEIIGRLYGTPIEILHARGRPLACIPTLRASRT